MSDFSDLDAWLETELKPQPPACRTLRPATPLISQPVLIGYIRLWHRRTCDQCGSEHEEFMAFYACYRTGSGAKILKAQSSLPEDNILPILDHEKDVTTLTCDDCAFVIEPTDEVCALLEPYISLLQ